MTFAIPNFTGANIFSYHVIATSWHPFLGKYEHGQYMLSIDSITICILL